MIGIDLSPADTRRIIREEKAIAVTRLQCSDVDELVVVGARWEEGHSGGGASVVFRVMRESGLEFIPIMSTHDEMPATLVDLESDGVPEVIVMSPCIATPQRLIRWNESLAPLPDYKSERVSDQRRETDLLADDLPCGRHRCGARCHHRSTHQDPPSSGRPPDP